MFKKVRYNEGDNIIKVTIEDETRRPIDKWTFMMTDLPNWVNIIKEKFGVNFNKKKKDLDWAM